MVSFPLLLPGHTRKNSPFFGHEKKNVTLSGNRTRDPWFTMHISNRKVPGSSPSQNWIFFMSGKLEFFPTVHSLKFVWHKMWGLKAIYFGSCTVVSFSERNNLTYASLLMNSLSENSFYGLWEWRMSLNIYWPVELPPLLLAWEIVLLLGQSCKDHGNLALRANV